MIGRPVEPPKVTLDQASFRALASDVRVDILKRLDARRMTVTDLSNAMNLSKPTLLEHLERLQGAGLVRRLDEGRKWIYYELTGKARKVLHPERVQIVLALVTSALLLGVGAFALVAGFLRAATPGALGPGTPLPNSTETFDRFAGIAATAGDAILLGVAFLLLALVSSLTALLLWRRARRRTIDVSLLSA